MRFARRARWLTHIFSPSETPTTRYPAQYSNDVSLTQNYDGGGWGIPDPREMFLNVVSGAAAAARDTIILTTGADEIIRLIALSGHISAGAAPTAANCSIFQPDANISVGLNNVVALNALIVVGMDGLPPVVPPTCELVASYIGGDVLTVINWRMCFLRLPLGTAPCL